MRSRENRKSAFFFFFRKSAIGRSGHEKTRISAGLLNGGMDGTRTRDLLRDRQAF